MTVYNQRIKEFNNLFNVHDLLPFYKLSAWWIKIALKFFQPRFDNSETPKKVSLSSRLVSVVEKYVQGLFPV